MSIENASLFCGRVSAGRTTYFIDVRQAVNDRFYISITESRRVSDTGFDQNRIFLFEENLEEISSMISEAAADLRLAVEKRGELPHEGPSGKYERSGKTWTEEEEDILRNEFSKGTERDAIALLLKRSAYAITLRLEKLELIEAPKEEKAIVS
ncbi:MAG: PUR family DNA/RNA-binding protein [Candidatus Aegiribacteria sp.]|nr:PUR family DNA/RNA-binding protein [Candidatus Aegiribacteria sp.]